MWQSSHSEQYVAEGDGSDDQLVPDSRTEFYSRVADELLVNRRVRQTGLQAGRTALRDLREQILGELALDHLLDLNQPANSLRWPDAIVLLAKRLEITNEAAEEVFAELSRETGLFTIERPRETFRFIHLTLCEFFAAAEAVKNRKDGWNLLIAAQRRHSAIGAAPDRQRLLEVVPFACGLLHRVHRDQAVTDVASLGDNRLLARCLLETKLYTHAAWKPFIDNTYQSLLTYRGAWDEEWLFDFHLFNVVVRDAAIAANRTGVRVQTPDLDAVLQKVVSMQEQGLAVLIDAYAEKDAAAVFRVAEVAGIDLVREFPEVVIRSLDQKPFMELLLERALASTDDVPRWAAILAEAGLRSRPVAKDLAGRPVAGAWDQHVMSLDRRHSWMVAGILAPSLYTQSVTIGSSSENLETEWLLAAVAQMPAPATFRWLLKTNVVGFIALACMFVGVRGDIFGLTRATHEPKWLIVMAAVGMAAFILLYPVLIARIAVCRIYRAVAGGLTTPAEHADHPSAHITFLRLFWLFIPRRLRVTAAHFALRKEELVASDGNSQLIWRLVGPIWYRPAAR